MTVFDPEFPLVDIWTMGLIYNISITSFESPQDGHHGEWEANIWSWDEDGFMSYGEKGKIVIDMTLTTPACPAADYLPEQAKNSVQIMYPEFEVVLNLVRDPTRTIEMLKDEDLKRMFE